MKKFLISVILTALLAACTDYVQQIDDRDGEWNRFVLSRMTDLRDGKTYKTVTIGNQTWMAENLNYEVNYKSNSFCYKDSTKYCAKYGHLYTWDAAMKACPDGWHLPSEDEFNTLFAAVGGQSVAAKMLKSSSGWQDGNGLDNYAFSALPVGRRYPDDGRYYLNGYAAYFWSSTENSSYGANYIYMDDNSDNPEIDNSDLSLAYSVRCVKDEGEMAESSFGVFNSSSSVTSSSDIESSSSFEMPVPIEGVMTDTRDGQSYKTVTIGSQTWLAENLNYKTLYSYCYNMSSDSCSRYGQYYEWSDAKEVCPEGWHLPSDVEWNILVESVGDYWNLTDESWRGNNLVKFSALEAGQADACITNEGLIYDSSVNFHPGSAFFWGIKEGDESEYVFSILGSYTNSFRGCTMAYLQSVRCLKDAQAE